MFSKRPDKHTTGLINMRNDCFANATIQAYSSLPGLTEYLNAFMKAYANIFDLEEKYRLSLRDLNSAKRIRPTLQSKARRERFDVGNKDDPIQDQVRITLHIALAKIMKKLQDTQMSTRTISVWTFLHELEGIYHAKISRSQHDAHELTQLINETLEFENSNCSRLLNILRESLLRNGGSHSDIESIHVPEFPLNGLLLSRMQCLNCLHLSKPDFTPFLMLTLHPPQSSVSDLESLLNENESETISGYHCLKCRIREIVEHVRHDIPSHLLKQFQQLNQDRALFINEEVPTELETYINDFFRNDTENGSMTSTVIRKTHILKPPKIFGIHLSRSTFDGFSVSRNLCRVAFNDRLNLSIKNEYVKELQYARSTDAMFQHISHETNILTLDKEDMENESVQVEDIDKVGLDSEVQYDSSDSGHDSYSASESTSGSSQGTESIFVGMDSSSRGSIDGKNDSSKTDLSNSLLYEGQLEGLKNHFQHFKFDENNIYKYRLRAIIKHQGSHTQGHYECYKRKPLFVKDSTGNVLKISPEIDESYIQKVELIGTTVHQPKNLLNSASYDERPNAFRNKISSIIGRRPSISQTDPEHANLQEIIHSGLATPAEVLIDRDDYFQSPSVNDLEELLGKVKLNRDQFERTKDKIRMKKIPTLIKHPFWKVGDAEVSEVSKPSVLLETASVYMLYYERTDRKQHKV